MEKIIARILCMYMQQSWNEIYRLVLGKLSLKQCKSNIANSKWEASITFKYGAKEKLDV